MPASTIPGVGLGRGGRQPDLMSVPVGPVTSGDPSASQRRPLDRRMHVAGGPFTPVWSRTEQCINLREARRLPIAIVAIACLLPPATLLIAAVGRQLQPAVFEPAATFQSVSDWFTRLSIAGLVLLLLPLPAVGTALGASLVAGVLRSDPALRSDLAGLAAALARIIRRPAFVLGVFAVAFGLVYFAMLAAWLSTR